MKQKLLTGSHKIFFAFLLCFFISSAIPAFSQISLNDNSSQTITFSTTRTQSSPGIISIPLNQFQNILSDDLRYRDEPWADVSENESGGSYTYLRNERNTVSAGKIELQNIPNRSFTGFSVVNQSDRDFDKIFLSFDFLFINPESRADHNLQLIYRLNNGEWRRSRTGSVSLSNFSAAAGELQSFSTQIAIDEIFLKSGEVMDFVWIFEESNEPPVSDLELYLQRIEIEPEYDSSAPISNGDLIITEIMPHAVVDGFSFEYIEIYNPGEEIKSLKGLEIRSSDKNYTIQTDVEVSPYGFIVLSNADLSDIDGISNSYFYSDQLFPKESGKVDFIQRGRTVASVTYEFGEENKALELRNVSAGVNGYSSLQDLSISNETFYSQLTGSPGRFGRTVPLYKKDLTAPGIYLLSIPGKLNPGLNRMLDIRFYDVNGEELEMAEVQPSTPVFVHKGHDKSITLVAESVANQVSQKPISYKEQGQVIMLTTEPGHDLAANLHEYQEINEPLTFGVWNREQFRFDVQTANDLTNDYWVPTLIGSNSKTGSNQLNRTRHALDNNTLNLLLFSEDGNERSFIDEAMIGFIDQRNVDSEIRFDLPKVSVTTKIEGRERRSSVLYLSHPEAEFNTNAFTHINKDLKERKNISVGYSFTPGTSAGNSLLRWDLPGDIPEEWEISLLDNLTGSKTDMRESNSYRFRRNETPLQQEFITGNSVQLQQELGEGENRFVIEISPPEVEEQIQEENESPGRIELRQNYPNPFNPTTTISFFLPEERQVRVGVYNIVGQQVATLVDDNIQAGEHSVVWDASNNPSGIYIVQLETGSRILTRKITLVK